MYNPLIDFVAGHTPEEKLANEQARQNELLQKQNLILSGQVRELKGSNNIMLNKLEMQKRESKSNKRLSIISIVIASLSLAITVLKIFLK